MMNPIADEDRYRLQCMDEMERMIEDYEREGMDLEMEDDVDSLDGWKGGKRDIDRGRGERVRVIVETEFAEMARRYGEDVAMRLDGLLY